VKVLIDPLKVGIARNVRTEEQSLDFTREDDAAAVVVIVDLFDTERIARQREAAQPRVPEGESEDADRLGERFGPILFHEVEKGLGIGGTPEAMASGEKALSKGGVVIELAVVGDPARIVLVRHGLSAGGGEIDDGKPTMAETEVTVEVKPFRIWAAMGQNPSHAHQKVAVNGPVGIGVVEDASNAAHGT
jgi:hypothetical protein